MWVLVDDNETRREIVRRKTAKYLIKAEKIHKQHLEDNVQGNGSSNRWDVRLAFVRLAFKFVILHDRYDMWWLYIRY